MGAAEGSGEPNDVLANETGRGAQLSHFKAQGDGCEIREPLF